MSDFRYVRPESFPPITKNLIIINVLVWIAQIIFDDKIGLTNILALHPIDTPEFRPYQIATHMFAHAARNPYGGIVFYHILFNMFTLWMFGRVLESFWGPKRFLLFYLACGVGAAICHLTVQHIRYDPLLVRAYQDALFLGDDVEIRNAASRVGFLASAVGASGAIMGVMAAFAYLFPNTPMYAMFIPIPIKAKYAILFFAALDLFGGVARISGDNIAHFAHLGGALTGFIIVLVWNRNRKTFY